MSFKFPTVKLSDYSDRWAELEASTNPFAIVVMAHLKTRETQHDPEYRQYWKFRIIRHAYDRGYQRQDILNLFRFIDWIMRLPDDLEREWIQHPGASVNPSFWGTRRAIAGKNLCLTDRTD